jgi:hypothetical protein
MGCDTFNPKIDLVGPDSVLLKSAGNSGSGGRDAELAFQLPVDGTFTVTVGTYYAKGAGSYTLSLASPPDPFTTAAGDQGGLLPNGAQTSGQIDVGDLDLWSFPASAGDSIILRMGATGLNPQIRLYGPTGLLVGSAANTGSGGRDTELSLTATNSGTFTVVVSSYYAGPTGPYTLCLAQSRAPFTTTAADQGGDLANGFRQPADIQLGDLDLWRFDAQAGEVLLVRMGATGFNPQLRLYGPDGGQVATGFNSSSGGRDAEFTGVATNAGTYLLVCSSYYPGGVGTYILTAVRTADDFVTAGGDEGGALINGVRQAGTLEAGDLDVWSFDAAAGDNLVIRMGATSCNPHLRLYGPGGVPIGSAFNGASGGRDTELSTQAPADGRYTLVAASYYPGGSGAYRLTLAQLPALFDVSDGDEGGPLVNGYRHHGSIAPGDLDLWRFNAAPGDVLLLRMGATSFNPHVRVYGPGGELLGSAINGVSGGRDAEFAGQATNGGSFTVVVSSYYPGGTGEYTLTWVGVPGTYTMAEGDEGGRIVSGTAISGAITMGDLDVWTFDACRDEHLGLRCERGSKDSTLNPRLRLYSQEGRLVAQAQGQTVASLDYQTVASGRYIVVVGSSPLGSVGAYSLAATGMAPEGLSLCRPHIAHDTLDLEGVGGPPDAICVLEATPSLDTTPIVWQPVLTNALSAWGYFGYTNRWNAAERQRFFRLHGSP